MKSKYQEFGKLLYLDFTFNLVRDHKIKEDEEKRYALGILSGFFNCRKIVAYAYCFCLG
jgi:hypothetical protein